MKLLLTYILVINFLLLSGQSAPVINSITPATTYPLDTLIINGSGFSPTPSSLQVWFGPVTGTVVASTNNLIEVVVPAQATTANLEVVNLTTKLSTKSNAKFA